MLLLAVYLLPVICACKDSGKAAPVPGKNMPAIVPAADSAAAPRTATVAYTHGDTTGKDALGIVISPEDQKLYITLQEDGKLYQQAQKEWIRLSPEYFAQAYQQPVPNAYTLYMLKKQKLIEYRKKSGFKVPQPYIPEGWEQPVFSSRQSELAELVYRYGDIDNLGYDWPKQYDPFSGKNTPPHGFPFFPEPDDPAGTDRIMVNTGYDYHPPKIVYPPKKADGYSTSTNRPENLPDTLKLSPDLNGIEVHRAILQLFVDDFQAPSLLSDFKVTINGRQAVFMEQVINALQQRGPIGKMISFSLLPEFIELLKTGKFHIYIDSPETPRGDGFAIDFAQLLINPKNIPLGTITGKVKDKLTGKPVAGAMIKISGVQEVRCDDKGMFSLAGVPCGMVVVQGSKAGYKSDSKTTDLVADRSATVTLTLEPESSNNLQQQLEEKGKVELYGIYFDTDKATIKPASEGTLQQVLALINKNPSMPLEIGGHTDGEGNDAYNMNLSEQRAEAVIQWLKDHKGKTGQLKGKGYGETQPVGDNDTETGRALNRRVEIKLIRQ